MNLETELKKNIQTIKQMYSNSSDLLVREFQKGEQNLAFVMCEGMINVQTFSEILVEPIMQTQDTDIMDFIKNKSILSPDQKEIKTYAECFQFIMSGFVVVLLDGEATGIALGMQGFSIRGIAAPESEVNIRGSREGFIEAARINLTMIRRRMKSPTLKFEQLNLGTKSKTDVFLIYLTDVVSQKALTDVKKRLDKVKIDVILETGYIQPFLESKPLSIFSSVGVTERPDTVCAKIAEGRIVILMDGTPYALIVPYLFNEHFQSFDDYSQRPFYATFIRWLKYTSFLITILLPGAYVAVATFHPEFFPNALLFNIAASEESTPFSLLIEALIIHLIYEIMREAGLRLPRPIGHAVSIVGGLVIGDAAVTAGLIGTPMVMVVALTAISSFVVPSLYDAIVILRFSIIIAGGMMGLFGISVVLGVVFVNLCAVSSIGIPSTSPLSPLSIFSMRDTLIRVGWKSLGKKDFKIQDAPGSSL